MLAANFDCWSLFRAKNDANRIKCNEKWTIQPKIELRPWIDNWHERTLKWSNRTVRSKRSWKVNGFLLQCKQKRNKKIVHFAQWTIYCKPILNIFALGVTNGVCVVQPHGNGQCWLLNHQLNGKMHGNESRCKYYVLHFTRYIDTTHLHHRRWRWRGIMKTAQCNV